MNTLHANKTLAYINAQAAAASHLLSLLKGYMEKEFEGKFEILEPGGQVLGLKFCSVEIRIKTEIRTKMAVLKPGGPSSLPADVKSVVAAYLVTRKANNEVGGLESLGKAIEFNERGIIQGMQENQFADAFMEPVLNDLFSHKNVVFVP
jgi:hypothetical protein